MLIFFTNMIMYKYDVWNNKYANTDNKNLIVTIVN